MKIVILFLALLAAGCVTTEAPPVSPEAADPPVLQPTPAPEPQPEPIPPEPLAPSPSFGRMPSSRPPIPPPPTPLHVARERLRTLADQAAEQERLVQELRARNTSDLEPRIRLRLETELLAELRRLDDLRTALRTHERLVERLVNDAP